MSKAYDSVNFELFTKSLERISMPQPLINILINLLTDRQNRVISNLGLTNFYSVKNGIDQGETITPLFWRIYYDPLINKIASQFSGYSLSTSWKTNLHSLQPQYLKTSVSVLAYMDDTLWIAKSKEELSLITKTAMSFYQMANIQINPTKSILATNSSTTSLQFSGSLIYSIPKNQPFKFLGCWFTSNNKHSQIIKLIKEEAFNLINIASTKKITDKQIAYIINTVIIPTLEYRLHSIILPRTVCNQILSKYLTVAKHKSHLFRSIPNSTMLNPFLYNIRNIWDIQLQHHIPNYLQRINNPDLLGITTRIRLQQLQNNLWSPISILNHPKPMIDGPNRNSLNFKIIQLFTHLGLTISVNSNSTWPHTINNSGQALEPILSQHSKYLTFKKQLRQANIMYLEQLYTTDNSTLLDWKHLLPRLLYLLKDRKPL